MQENIATKEDENNDYSIIAWRAFMKLSVKARVLLIASTVLVFNFGLIALFMILSWVPFGTISSYSLDRFDALHGTKGTEHRIIEIIRPHYLIPREYSKFTDVGIDYWNYFSDPHFRKTIISSHFFIDLNNAQLLAQVQGLSVNPFFSETENREQIMAIRILNDQVFEYSTPGFNYERGLAESARFKFLGQEDGFLYYHYPFAGVDEQYTKDNWKSVEAIVKLKLPLESGVIEVVKSNNADDWQLMMKELSTIDS